MKHFQLSIFNSQLLLLYLQVVSCGRDEAASDELALTNLQTVMKKILMLIVVAAAGCHTISFAQDGDLRYLTLMARNAKGKVIKNLELRAFVKGTSDVKTLDKFGNRIFRVADTDTLDVIVGYDAMYEIPVAGLDSVYLIVKGRTKVDAVKSVARHDMINVGYGKVSRENNTTAVSELDMSEVGGGHTDLMRYLEGRVAGLTFIRGQLRIRSYDAEPLIIVDGRPYGSAAEVNRTIGAQDVETVTVLKDASASIYGSRGANGVLLITTRKGQKK